MSRAPQEASPSIVLGIAGAARNAAIALCDGGRVVAVCEHERVTRTRRAALPDGQLPSETLELVLRLAGRVRRDISAYAIAEEAVQLPSDLRVTRVDHHYAHAATSFYTSPFDEATVLICDRHSVPELTVWRGDDAGIRREQFPWFGPAFATVYSLAAEALGFAVDGDEHKFEGLARIARRNVEAALPLIAYREDQLEIPAQFRDCIARLVAPNGHRPPVTRAAQVANGVQESLAQLLLQVVGEIKNRIGGRNLCLGGGLFYNSYINTVLAESGLYEKTFVPINPGNAGLAVGAALALADQEAQPRCPGLLSPFLGPEYRTDEVKAILDNCKLSYDYVRDDHVIDRTTAALAKGQLVGWFQGRMEWGPRALGNRSILASPVAPYVLENLNVFLKQREPYRSYNVSVCAEDAPRYFRGPATSHFMEYEYEVIDPDIVRALLPLDATRLRVQTVPESAGQFYRLLRSFGDLTGVPILVNTSFNGFNEPIVCTPRDAVRVFHGTGLDMAVIGSFVLHK